MTGSLSKSSAKLNLLLFAAAGLLFFVFLVGRVFGLPADLASLLIAGVAVVYGVIIIYDARTYL